MERFRWATYQGGHEFFGTQRLNMAWIRGGQVYLWDADNPHGERWVHYPEVDKLPLDEKKKVAEVLARMNDQGE